MAGFDKSYMTLSDKEVLSNGSMLNDAHINCDPPQENQPQRGGGILELARAGQSTFNQLSFGTKISFIPGSVPELRHFEVTEVKKSTMEKRSKTLIIVWVGVN